MPIYTQTCCGVLNKGLVFEYLIPVGGAVWGGYGLLLEEV